MDRARHAIRALMDLTPQEALVVDKADVRVGVDDVAIGEIVRVRPGESAARRRRGRRHQRREPGADHRRAMPAEKQPGDQSSPADQRTRCAADARDQAGATRRWPGSSTSSRRRSRSARLAAVRREFAQVYTPAVLALAALVAIVPPLAGRRPVTDWIYRALVLLVIACPARW